MSRHLDELGRQAVLDTPTRVPPMSEVRRRASRWRRGRIARAAVGAVAVFGVVGGGLWTATGSDGKTSVLSDGRKNTTSNVPQEHGVISGTLPDGERYRVISGGLDGTVRGVSAGIVLDSGQTPPRAVGVASFQRSDERPQQEGAVVVASGDWVLHLVVYDDVRSVLGADTEERIASSIVASRVAHSSGLPSFALKAPLRWATDQELPLQMAVLYDEFVVRRGCSTTAKTCSEDRSLQIIAAADVYAPSAPWPGGSVRIITD